MTRTPDRLKYGVDDRPPPGATAVLAVQHAGLALVFMVYPVAIAQAVGLDAAQTATLITASILATAFGTLLQQCRPPIGCGMLGVQIPTPVLLPAMVQAGLAGGIGLMAGMTLVLGVAEVALARLLRRLRAYLPPEVCGVVVLMLGVSLAEPALVGFAGAANESGMGSMRADPDHLLVAGATLATIVLVSIFTRGAIKLFALAIGIAVGVVLSAWLGLVDADTMQRLRDAPLVGMPTFEIPRPSFDWSLVPLFVLMALVSGIDDLGVLVGLQRLVDADWKKIDMAQGAGGVQAGGVADVFAGAVGAAPGGLSSAHVGLVFATGAAARIVAVATALLLLVAVFTPKVVIALASIPQPVIGALLVYTAAYMMVAGMELIQSRMLSERRMFTVGLSIVLGLSPLVLPGVYHAMPPTLAPVFHSGLALASIAALALNLLFRIGIAQQARVPVGRELQSYAGARAFLEEMGKLWGARHDVIERAIHASAEALEAVRGMSVAPSDLSLTARFDEVDLVVTLVYRGAPLDCPTAPPSADDVLADDDHLSRLAGYIVRRSVDRLVHKSEGDLQRLSLHFEH